MPGGRAGSPIAVYAQVQCREPKTGQPKVQLYCEDDSHCQSGYIIYLWIYCRWHGKMLSLLFEVNIE